MKDFGKADVILEMKIDIPNNDLPSPSAVVLQGLYLHWKSAPMCSSWMCRLQLTVVRTLMNDLNVAVNIVVVRTLIA